MVDVFVSYAHEDRTRIEPLVARFEAEGWSVWWDRDITPGEQFSQTIDTAIQSASCIVVAWSRASLKSSWVHNEALEGLDRGVLVPVALDVIRTPVAFRQSQAALLTKWPAEYDPKELEALLHGIRRMLDAADRSDVADAPIDSGPGGRNETLAILRQFEAQGEVEKAVAVAQRLAQGYPLDDEVQALWLNHSALYELVSEPEGAQVFSKPYVQPEDNWRLLGATPLEVRLPHGTLRFKVELDGYDVAEFCDTVPGFEDKSGLGEIFGVALPRQVQLQSADAMRGDRVFVPGGDLAHLVAGGAVGRRNVIADYFIDRYPVTNADYQAFVDMGGYSDESLWADLTFDEAGEVHTLHEALARFVDATGRPGPVGWQFAQFPEGEQDFPVTGISWFEASAYAKFAGGALPTAAHWNRAAREYQEVLSTFSGAVVAQSNFSEHLQPVTESTAVGAFGIRDMAGNAREWVRNAMVDGYATLGGSHLDPGYMFIFNAPVAPWQRDGLTGFRTMVSLGKDDPYLERPIHSFGEPRDFSPVGDDVFQILETQFGYTPATPKVTIREVASPSRRRRYERVALNFTDGTSLELYVIVPASANHPLQPLICFPGQTDFQSHRETSVVY